MSRLFIRLRSPPRFAYFPASVSPLATSEGEFRDLGLGGWTGFYDWLRAASGRLVGLRFWPFEQAEFLLKEIPISETLLVASRGAILVFFGDETRFVDGASGDQAFEEARVLVSPSKEYALVFGCSDLSDSERQTLRDQFPSNVEGQ